MYGPPETSTPVSSLLTRGRCSREIQPSGSEVPSRNTSAPGSSSSALGIAIGDRLDGHSITHLGPEGLEFGLDPLAVFLLESLVSQPLLEAIHSYESHSRSLRRSLARVLGDHQTMLQPILAVGQVHDADPTGRFELLPAIRTKVSSTMMSRFRSP